MEQLVIYIDEVLENMVQFNKDLEQEAEIISQLSQFKHWYYVPELDLLAPSKYIGYSNMNTKKYNRGFNKTGVDTEKVLKQWFIKLHNSSEKSIMLMNKLDNLLEPYNKKARSNAVVHIIKNSIKSEISDI